MKKIYIYISFFIIIILSFVYFSKTVIADVDTSIPAVPDNFKGLDLRENFHDVVNYGGGFSYSKDNSILQMTNWYNQRTAIWGKNQVDLSQYFKVEFYFYMGNSGADAADGMVFGLQNYSPSYVGDAGSGMGFYSDREAYKVAVEFDTYFNADSQKGDAPDSWFGPHGDNGLKSRANHMAVATSDKNWKNYQYHYSASSIGTNTMIPNQFFSNGAWKKVVIEGKPIAGKPTQTMLCYSMYDLGYGTTIYGECMVDFNSNMNDYSSHHFLRSKYAYWGFTASTGLRKEIAAMSFGTLPQTATLTTKDVTIYAGQDWNPSMNFISGMDEKAQLFGYDDSRLTQENNVDTSKPGTYMVNYYYKNGNFDAHSEANVIVKEDKTSIIAKNSELYVGETWNKESNFVSATDENGVAVKWNDPRISISGDTVNTSKPGVYKLKYVFQGNFKTVEAPFTVTVKEDKTSIIAKNSELYVGETWNKESNFVSATDENGVAVKWNDPRISISGDTVNTSKPGVYKLKYVFQGNFKTVEAPFTVTVLKQPLELIVPEGVEFGKYSLGSILTTLNWPNDKVVKVIDNSSIEWNLSVRLIQSKEKDFYNFLFFDNKNITGTPINIFTDNKTVNINDKLKGKSFIYVDYKNVEKIRSDQGVLEWSLSPSIKEVSE